MNPNRFFEIKSKTLIIAFSLYFTLVLNLSFFRQVYTNIDISSASGIILGISFPIVLFLALLLIFTLFLQPYLAKPLGVIVLLISSAANYWMFQYGVYIDADMIRNVFETTPRESLDYFNLSIVLWVFFTGILPALYLIKTRIVYAPFLSEAKMRGAIIGIALVLVGLMAALTYKEFSIFGRNHKDIVRLINPTNYVYGTVRFFQKKIRARQPFMALDPDSRYAPYRDPYKTVFVLLVGETARAMNFSLNGYSKPTNPKLAQEDIVNFSDVTSCGTYTALSVPCIFSNLPRKEFNLNRAPYIENLVDLLRNNGYQIQWFDNDEGCKEVCKRVPTVYMTDLGNKKYCDKDYCYDEVFLEPLETYLNNIQDNSFIVLHMMGSHGPSYYKRYPDAFARFTPTCYTGEVQNCDKNAIVNTYDNTILYTDHVIAEVIRLLKKYPDYEIGLMYVSDHGESLGENNIYLHGIPYAVAPKEQTRVPMLLWMSSMMKKEDHINYECLKEKSRDPISHDYIFHSLISLMEVRTKLYRPELDLFASCRTQPLPE
ncbi:MAG: phosphoethanolamine--lipid A transferase [Burkholderiales bacterium]|jgi:lipid A ethanolaminephosphotransferase|nr:phosphoethanolamine--lipid A transferase [Burkholderiales bacterium]